MTADEMRKAWSNRYDETLSDAEADYLTREWVEPGYNDFGSLTVLHAFRAGWATALREREAATASGEPW